MLTYLVAFILGEEYPGRRYTHVCQQGSWETSRHMLYTDISHEHHDTSRLASS